MNETYKSGIYFLYNMDKNKFYIGSSKNITIRIKNHFRDLKRNRHYNNNMQSDYNNGDHFTSGIIKELEYSSHRALFTEEGLLIADFRKQGKDLYNIQVVSTNYFVPESQYKDALLNKLCKEKFGKTYTQLTQNYVPAEFSMMYELLYHPEEAEKIKKNYAEIINYQKRERFALSRYN